MTSTITRGVRAMLAPALLAATFMAAPLADAQNHVRLKIGGAACGFDADGKPAPSGPGARANRAASALNVETGKLQISGYGPGWLSAQWILRPAGAPDTYTIENLWTHKLLAAWPIDSKNQVVDVVDDQTRIPETIAGLKDRQPMRTPGGQETIWTMTKLRDADPSRAIASAWHIFQPGVRDDRSGSKWFLSMDPAGCAPKIAFAAENFETTFDVEITGAEAAPPPADGYAWLQTVGGGLEAINIETGAPSYSKVEAGWLSAQWERKSLSGQAQQLQPLSGPPALYINRWTGKALALDSAGALTTVDPPTFDNAGKLSSRASLWQEVPGNGGFQLKNGAKFINVDAKGKLVVEDTGKSVWAAGTNPPGYVAPKPVEQYVRLRHDKHAINNETGAPTSTDYQPGWYSAQWVVETMGSSQGRFVAYRNRWTDKYLGVVNGQLAMVDRAANLQDPSQATYAWRVVGGSPDASLKSLQNLKSSLYLDDSAAGASLGSKATFIWREEDVQ